MNGKLLLGTLLVFNSWLLQAQDVFYGVVAGTRANFSTLSEPIPKDDYRFEQGRALHGWELYGFYRWEWDGWYVEPQFGYFSSEVEVYVTPKSAEQSYDFVGIVQQDNISAMIFGGAKLKDMFRVYVGLINTLNVGGGLDLVDGRGTVDRVNMGYSLGIGVDLDVFMRLDLTYRSFLLDQETEVAYGAREQKLEQHMHFLSIQVGFFFN